MTVFSRKGNVPKVCVICDSFLVCSSQFDHEIRISSHLDCLDNSCG